MHLLPTLPHCNNAASPKTIYQFLWEWPWILSQLLPEDSFIRAYPGTVLLCTLVACISCSSVIFRVLHLHGFAQNLWAQRRRLLPFGLLFYSTLGGFDALSRFVFFSPHCFVRGWFRWSVAVSLFVWATHTINGLRVSPVLRLALCSGTLTGIGLGLGLASPRPDTPACWSVVAIAFAAGGVECAACCAGYSLIKSGISVASAILGAIRWVGTTIVRPVVTEVTRVVAAALSLVGNVATDILRYMWRNFVAPVGRVLRTLWRLCVVPLFPYLRAAESQVRSTVAWVVTQIAALYKFIARPVRACSRFVWAGISRYLYRPFVRFVNATVSLSQAVVKVVKQKLWEIITHEGAISRMRKRIFRAAMPFVKSLPLVTAAGLLLRSIVLEFPDTSPASVLFQIIRLSSALALSGLALHAIGHRKQWQRLKEAGWTLAVRADARLTPLLIAGLYFLLLRVSKVLAVALRACSPILHAVFLLRDNANAMLDVVNSVVSTCRKLLRNSGRLILDYVLKPIYFSPYATLLITGIVLSSCYAIHRGWIPSPLAIFLFLCSLCLSPVALVFASAGAAIRFVAVPLLWLSAVLSHQAEVTATVLARHDVWTVFHQPRVAALLFLACAAQVNLSHMTLIIGSRRLEANGTLPAKAAAVPPDVLLHCVTSALLFAPPQVFILLVRCTTWVVGVSRRGLFVCVSFGLLVAVRTLGRLVRQRKISASVLQLILTDRRTVRALTVASAYYLTVVAFGASLANLVSDVAFCVLTFVAVANALRLLDKILRNTTRTKVLGLLVTLPPVLVAHWFVLRAVISWVQNRSVVSQLLICLLLLYWDPWLEGFAQWALLSMQRELETFYMSHMDQPAPPDTEVNVELLTLLRAMPVPSRAATVAALKSCGQFDGVNIDHWVEKAAVFVSSRRLGVDHERAMALHMYTQEWYPHMISEAMEVRCDHPACPNRQGARVYEFVRIVLRKPVTPRYTCGNCQRPVYCSEHCLQKHWSQHKYDLDCNRSLYRLLNRHLLNKDNKLLEPLLPYTKLLLAALASGPSRYDGVVWRAMRLEYSMWRKYRILRPGAVFVWHTFSSTSTDAQATKEFLGHAGHRILFRIRCVEGYSIANFSEFAEEAEVLLPMESAFKVEKVEELGELLEISLEQLQGRPKSSSSPTINEPGSDHSTSPGTAPLPALNFNSAVQAGLEDLVVIIKEARGMKGGGFFSKFKPVVSISVCGIAMDTKPAVKTKDGYVWGEPMRWSVADPRKHCVLFISIKNMGTVISGCTLDAAAVLRHEAGRDHWAPLLHNGKIAGHLSLTIELATTRIGGCAL
eukprot:TRINITY_DN13577_c0_g1_i1.p1 TRINITY_DN13577_c0_g1~~TRINITY_DN13577_c0_g1_i1.p1  ORF type:complete len:1310 (+),score=147.36 TRINITY_DN13577_c0_g1_i1:42-3971(+)